MKGYKNTCDFSPTKSKETLPTMNNEASSALWIHSRDAHEGQMGVADWKSSILSSHFTALSRQVTEAVLISEKGGGGGGGDGRPVNHLNSKQEFGANLILEMVIMRGDQV